MADNDWTGSMLRISTPFLRISTPTPVANCARPAFRFDWLRASATDGKQSSSVLPRLLDSWK